MRRIFAGLLIILAALSTCACRSSVEPEHEAYAISMSVDRTQDGFLTVGVQVPTLGAGDSSDESSGKSSYQTYTATSRTFPQALDLLMATIPARLVLAHLKSIVVSYDLALEPRFGILVSDMIETYQLYGSSNLIVAKGEALDFIKAQKPAIGKRFSTAFMATIEHYADMGYVPLSTLYEVYASMHGIYSDPILAYAAKSEVAGKSPSGGEASGGGSNGAEFGMGDQSPHAGDLPGDGEAGSLARTGPDENEFMGCALTRDGSVAGTLTGAENALLALINGRVDSVSFFPGDIASRVKPDGKPRFEVRCLAEKVDIALEMKVYISAISEITDMREIERELKNNVENLIKKTQSLGTEPFGLAEKAARQFLTADDFLAYGFREKFCQTEVKVSVSAQRERGEG